MTRIYHTAFNVLALSVLLYTGVDIVYRVVRARLNRSPVHEAIASRPSAVQTQDSKRLGNYQIVIERNLFGSLEQTREGIQEEEIEALEPTTLNIALLGTVAGGEGRAFAVIEDKDEKKQGLYKIGQTIKGATLLKVLRGKVVLRVGDSIEVLVMDEPGTAAVSRESEPSPPKKTGQTTQISVNHQDIQKSLQNVNKLLSQVRIQPHMNEGKADGLAVSRIKPGSVFAKLGLEDGDIVHGINGKPIQSPDDVLGLYKKLRAGSQISLQLSRDGALEEILYTFK